MTGDMDNASSRDLGLLATVDFRGGVKASDDVSAISRVDDYLVIGADEAVGDDENENIIQVFRPDSDDESLYHHHVDITVFKGEAKEELDIEGIAAVGRTVYVIGSHSRKRSKVKPDRTYKKNRKTFRGDKVKKETSRSQLFRLRLNANGKLVKGSKARTNLAEVIEKDPVLGAFRSIPSKENGIDIEGIAADGQWLYLGFRGPVLREGYVPVMRLRFDDPADSYELLYVNLDGRGIRDIVRVSDGFLILAGPVGDGPGTYRIYHWDGKDVIPGKDRDPDDIGRVTLVRDLALSAEAKAEGVAVLEDDDGVYDVIVVFDGVLNLLALRYRLAVPR